MYQRNLKENFNKNNLFIHDKFDKQMFKAWNKNDVYIIYKITKNFNEFILNVIKQRIINVMFLTYFNLLNN